MALARYDEEGRHWNYLKVKGPMFLVSDRFQKYRLVIMNQLDPENYIIHMHQDMQI